ncbi:MAG TPA: hypothetical protein VK081_03540 [Planctomycetota bacterium]|nr:hypothetical protein [Planctomycetota bacterium]
MLPFLSFVALGPANGRVLSFGGLLLFVALAAWGLWILAERHSFRRALVATVTTPALLVPAGMMLFGSWLLVEFSPGHRVHENPFGLANAKDLGLSRPINLAAFALATVVLAGHVGLLRAWNANRKPDGYAFFRGIVDHTLTIGLGKLALFGGAWLLSCLRPDRVGNVVYIIPTLLLAPLVCAAAAHPRRPVTALCATLRTSYHRFDVVGGLASGK